MRQVAPAGDVPGRDLQPPVRVIGGIGWPRVRGLTGVHRRCASPFTGGLSEDGERLPGRFRWGRRSAEALFPELLNPQRPRHPASSPVRTDLLSAVDRMRSAWAVARAGEEGSG